MGPHSSSQHRTSMFSLSYSYSSLLLIAFLSLIILQVFYSPFSTSFSNIHRSHSTHILPHRIHSDVIEDNLDILTDPTKISLPNLDQEFLEEVGIIYVLPGGGSSTEYGGYPEWTKQRVLAAVENYH